MLNINTKLIEEFVGKKSQILAITKYFDSEVTDRYRDYFQKYKEHVIGFGENRIAQIIEKKLPREDVHFIGNIQSRDIKNIVDCCLYIHSVGNKKHLLKIAEQAYIQKKKVSIFLQVQLDSDKNIGFCENEIIDVLSEKFKNQYIEIIGISGMGIAEFTTVEKIAEFQYLRDIRERCMPEGKISAGTSRDYDIALEMNIDIIRIGKKLFD